MVIDEFLEQVHLGLLRGGREAEAARRLEMHTTRAGQLQLAEGERRHGAHRRGGRSVGPGERPGEGLVRAVARLDGDVEDGARDRPWVVHPQQPVCRPLEQQPAPHRPGRLARRRGDDPVEVEAGQVGSRREVVRARLGVVETRLSQVEDGRQVVRGAEVR
nr:hypothetical protein [Lapillicoccus sp.]